MKSLPERLVGDFNPTENPCRALVGIRGFWGLRLWDLGFRVRAGWGYRDVGLRVQGLRV